MEKYNLQFKGEQKWASQEQYSFQEDFFEKFKELAQKSLKKITGPEHQNLEKDIEKAKLLHEQFKTNYKDAVSSEEYNNYIKNKYAHISFPTTTAATRLANAYSSHVALDNISFFDRVITVFETVEEYRQLYIKNKELFLKTIPGLNWDNSYYDSNTGKYLYAVSSWANTTPLKSVKKIKAIQKKISDGEYVSAVRTTESGFMNKTAWAIFCKFEYSQTVNTGYKDKKGELGDISTARLFDSDKGAQRTANAMGLKENQYDIVELQVSYKKRMHMTNGFNSSELDAAEAILEKQKIEAFFKEVSIDKIEEHVEQVKAQAKKRNKI